VLAQLATEQEAQERGKNEGFSDEALTRRQLLETVSKLQLAEEQLDLPAGGVDWADVVGGDHVAGDVGEIEVVPRFEWMPLSDESNRQQVSSPIGAAIEAPGNQREDVDGLPEEVVLHGREPLATPTRVNDNGVIIVFLRSRKYPPKSAIRL